MATPTRSTRSGVRARRSSSETTRRSDPIEALARGVGWSRRHLERRFLEHAGVGPKDLANILRLHAVYKRIRRSADGHYAPLIQDHYCDQSHFLKAFKQFAGVTPSVCGDHDYGLVYIPD